MSCPTFSLRVSDLHWLRTLDAEVDLCAHGTVEVRVGDEILLDTGLAVGPACVLLLRVLDDDHEITPSEPLVPCCGHAFFVDEEGRWLNINCNDGLDWNVRHADGSVSLSTPRTSVTIPHAEWMHTVAAFCDQVEQFYRDSAPKAVTDDTAKGYEAFWREWRERRAVVR